MSRAKHNKGVARNDKDAARKDAALSITIPTNLTACQALIEQLACTVDSLTHALEKLLLRPLIVGHV